VATKIYLETGKKRVFASSLRWPGWARFAASEEAAIEALDAYASRYAAFLKPSGVPFRAERFDIVERRQGGGSTDFGVPDKPATADEAHVPPKERQRLATILATAWDYFDTTVASSPAELRKGPRGGGRDRDKMAAHVLEAELAYARMIGLKQRDTEPLADRRAAILEAVRDPRGEWKWPLPYAVRRFTWHLLDHAWEMEDRSTPSASEG
jgi:hypothetical protein